MNHQSKKYKQSVSLNISEIEKQNEQHALSESLKEIHDMVKKNCENFKNDKFYKDLNRLEENLVYINYNR
jgi:hypothetical protein